MRFHALLSAAVPVLFACSSGSPSGGSGMSETTGMGSDGAATSSEASGDAGAAALPDCFGTPRNGEGRCEAELIADNLAPPSGVVFGFAASHGVAFVGTSAGLVRVSSPNQKESVSDALASGVVTAGEYLAWSSYGSIQVAKPSDPRAARPLPHFAFDRLLAARGKYLVVSSGNSLMRVDATADGPATTLVGSVWADLSHAAVDDTNVYYFSRSDATASAVSRVPLAGGTPQLVAALDKNDAGGSFLAVSSSTLFFRTDAGLRALSKTVREAPKLLVPGELTDLVADVDGSGVFWTTRTGSIGRIYRADANGTNQRLLAELPFEWANLTVDETALYILDGKQRTLYRLPKR